jgi:TetR/AcrR family transcriptional regulator
MKKENMNTEAIILAAAKSMFVKHGLDGAKMQQIANEAGINKALLHYYFRSKDKLFEAVLEDVFAEIAPILKSFFGEQISLTEKIGFFVEAYTGLIKKNPFLPEFVFNELNRSPNRLVNIMISVGVNPQIFLMQIKQEIEKGSIKNFDPRQLLVNILSLTIFPFIAKPIFMRLMFGNKDAQFNEFLEERKSHIKDFISNAILPK